MHLLEFNTSGQRWTFTLLDAAGARITDFGGVTALRRIDGGAWEAVGGAVALADTDKLEFTCVAADANGSQVAWMFDHDDAARPEIVHFRTSRSFAEKIFRTPLVIRTFVGLDDSQVEVMDCLGAAFLNLAGVPTAVDLGDPDSDVELTYPGGSTVILSYALNSPIADYYTDRGFEGFLDMTPDQRATDALTDPTVADCLIGGFVIAGGSEAITGTSYARLLPDGSGNYVNFTLNSASNPTARTR